MRRFFFVAAVIFILSCLEIILSTHFILFRFKPNLLFLAVIFFTIYLGLAEGLFSAAIAGILKDAFSLNPFALNLMVFLICVGLVNYFKKYIYRETVLTVMLTVISAGLINGLLDYFVVFFARGITFGSALLSVILPEIILTAALAAPLFFYLKRCALKFSI